MNILSFIETLYNDWFIGLKYNMNLPDRTPTRVFDSYRSEAGERVKQKSFSLIISLSLYVKPQFRVQKPRVLIGQIMSYEPQPNSVFHIRTSQYQILTFHWLDRFNTNLNLTQSCTRPPSYCSTSSFFT